MQHLRNSTPGEALLAPSLVANRLDWARNQCFFFFRGVGNFEKKMGQCYQWRRAWNSKLLFSVWWRVAGKHEWGCVLCSCGRFDDPNSTLPLRCCMGCYYFDPLRRNAVLPHQARQVCFSALIRCAAREGPQAIEDTDHAVRMIGC